VGSEHLLGGEEAPSQRLLGGEGVPSERLLGGKGGPSERLLGGRELACRHNSQSSNVFSCRLRGACGCGAA
jgi:hypothetical protein